MRKIKQRVFMVLDTETIGVNSRAYIFDIGYTIATKNRVLLERTFLVREVLTNENMMLGAYRDYQWRGKFGGKIFFHYIPALNNRELELRDWSEIVEIMREDMLTFDVCTLSAYNLNFDKRAMEKTQSKIVGKSKILEYRPDLLCLWYWSCNTIFQSNLYHDIAKTRGWYTEKGNVLTTAEKAFAFLTGELDFVESHTALHDAQIETELLQRLLKRKQRVPYNARYIFSPWRRAQRKQGILL